MRSLGVGTSVNHTSETQVKGLKERLQQIAEAFNNSPFAKREHLTFMSDDFAYKLIGTSGDHAADQKKSHELIRGWKTKIIHQHLGEEALLKMEITNLIVFLLPLKIKKIEGVGGYGEWEKLGDEERSAADTEIVQEVGKQVFDALPEIDRTRLTCFIRTGCCMHKDLNTVKGGDKFLREAWEAENNNTS